MRLIVVEHSLLIGDVMVPRRRPLSHGGSHYTRWPWCAADGSPCWLRRFVPRMAQQVM